MWHFKGENPTGSISDVLTAHSGTKNYIQTGKKTDKTSKERTTGIDSMFDGRII